MCIHACMLPQICCRWLQFHSVCTLWLPGHQRLLFSPLSVSGIFILSNYRHGVIGLSPSCRTITLQRSAALYVSNTHGISHLIPPKQKRRIVATNVKYTFGPFFASNYQTNFLLAFFVGAKCTTNLILTSKYFALLETKTPVRLPIPVWA